MPLPLLPPSFYPLVTVSPVVHILAWMGGHVSNQDADEVTAFVQQQMSAGQVWTTQAAFDALFAAFTQTVQVVSWPR